MTETTPAPSFYWYDLETSGTDPRWDRVMQFAGVRTDLDLNEIGDSFSTYVKLPLDVLPHPMSCAITGLTPQFINEHGIHELQFFSRADELLSVANTCAVGFNSLRFDDEFMRYGFYRHLIDPFAREWRNGNSRWDLIDLVRAAQALRPDGVNWPREEQLPTFRLAALSAANNIGHEHAHDASSDVRATIAIAKLIKTAQPRLFQYHLSLRRRDDVRKVLHTGEWRICLHVSGMFPRERNCIAPIVAIAPHPHNGNVVIVADLGKDVTPLIEWDAERIREALFSREPGNERPGLKEVRLNRCPFVAPLSVLRLEDKRRLSIDVDRAAAQLQRLRDCPGVAQKVQQVYARERDKERQALDVDVRLYDGFWGDADRHRCVRARKALLAGEDPRGWEFDDDRILELIRRIRWRMSIFDSDGEREKWLAFVWEKLQSERTLMTVHSFKREVDRCFGQFRSLETYRSLHAHAESIANQLPRYRELSISFSS